MRHIEDTIENLNEIRLSKPISVDDILDFLRGNKESISSKYPTEHIMLMYKIEQITDDSERKKIIKRHIKSVDIKSTKIRFPFGIGEKDVLAREVAVHSNTVSYTQKELLGLTEAVDVFYIIPNGGNGPMILDISPDEVEEGIDPTFYSYNDNVNYYYVDIAPNILMIRYRDITKQKRRQTEREEAYKDVDGYLRIEDVMAMTNLKYNQVYSAINKGFLNALKIKHKYFIAPKDAEDFKLRLNQNN